MNDLMMTLFMETQINTRFNNESRALYLKKNLKLGRSDILTLKNGYYGKTKITVSQKINEKGRGIVDDHTPGKFIKKYPFIL